MIALSCTLALVTGCAGIALDKRRWLAILVVVVSLSACAFLRVDLFLWFQLRRLFAPPPRIVIETLAPRSGGAWRG